MSADDQGTNSIKLLANVSLPMLGDVVPAAMSNDQTLRVEGTNVVRVPFGVRRPLRTRPARPDHWATLVIPFQAGGSPTPPPQAA